MACLPPYQPQLPQTTWGSLAWRHWGHSLRGGAARRQLEARRLRLFAFEVFFLGTAIVFSFDLDYSGRVGAQRIQCRPPRVPVLVVGVVRCLVQIGPAPGAQPAAVLRAERGLRQLQEHHLARQWLEVDLFVAKRIAVPFGGLVPGGLPEAGPHLAPAPLEAPPALAGPWRHGGARGQQPALPHRLEQHVEADVGVVRDAAGADRQARQAAGNVLLPT